MTTAYMLRALLRRWPLIAASAVVAAVVGVLVAAVSAPVYRSTVTTLLTVSSAEGGNNVTSATNAVATVAPTLAEISSSRSVLNAVSASTGVPAAELADRVSVSNPTNTLLIVVSARGSSQQEAQDIVIATTAALADHTSSLNIVVDNTVTPLSLSEVDSSPEAQLVDPSKSRYGAIGLITGAMAGLLLSLLLEAGAAPPHEELHRAANRPANTAGGYFKRARRLMTAGGTRLSRLLPIRTRSRCR